MEKKCDRKPVFYLGNWIKRNEKIVNDTFGEARTQEAWRDPVAKSESFAIAPKNVSNSTPRTYYNFVPGEDAFLFVVLLYDLS